MPTIGAVLINCCKLQRGTKLPQSNPTSIEARPKEKKGAEQYSCSSFGYLATFYVSFNDISIETRPKEKKGAKQMKNLGHHALATVTLTEPRWLRNSHLAIHHTSRIHTSSYVSGIFHFAKKLPHLAKMPPRKENKNNLDQLPANVVHLLAPPINSMEVKQTLPYARPLAFEQSHNAMQLLNERVIASIHKLLAIALYKGWSIPSHKNCTQDIHTFISCHHRSATPSSSHSSNRSIPTATTFSPRHST